MIFGMYLPAWFVSFIIIIIIIIISIIIIIKGSKSRGGDITPNIIIIIIILIIIIIIIIIIMKKALLGECRIIWKKKEEKIDQTSSVRNRTWDRSQTGRMLYRLSYGDKVYPNVN